MNGPAPPADRIRPSDPARYVLDLGVGQPERPFPATSPRAAGRTALLAR